jgi:hypothetical protein
MALTTTLAPTRSSTSNTVVSPSTLNLRYGYTLPLPVPSRAATSLLTLRLKASRALKVALGAVIGLLGIIATWWALDLAMWNSVKEWRDDCRNQKVWTTFDHCYDFRLVAHPFFSHSQFWPQGKC